jgi:large repetitive protein
MIMLSITVHQLYAQPVILDLDYNTLSFINANRSVIIDNGNNGYSQGSVHRYNNIITKNGKTVFGLLIVQEVSKATILNFDDDLTYGVPGRFQPSISFSTNDGGYIVYQLQFFDAATNEDIFLSNYSITGIDLDGISFSNREFVEYSGNYSYEVNNPSQLQISNNAFTGKTRLLGGPHHLPGMGFENTTSYIINYKFPNNSISFTLGQTGQSIRSDYSLQFGKAEGTFSNPYLTINPLIVAIDDIGTPVNSNTGGVSVNNVLNNDFYNGNPVLLSQVSISLYEKAENSGISLNTSTGVVTVAPGTPAGTYTLKYQICMSSNPSGRCDIASVKVTVLSADLSINQTDSPIPVLAGQNVTFCLTVTNNGPTYAQNVSVDEILPAGLSLISATPSSGTWNNSTWNIGKLSVSNSETILIVAKVANNITANVRNLAHIYTLTYDPVSSNNSVSQITSVSSSSNLSITMTASPDPGVAGQSLTYSIIVSNNGPSDALHVIVNDILPDGLTLLGTDFATGTWTSPAWTIDTLKSGSSATLNLEAVIDSDYSGMISNTATVSSTTVDPVLNDNISTEETNVNSLADLSVAAIFNNDTLIAGELIDYTIKITNNGPGIARSIQLIDNFTAELQFVQFSSDNGITWNFWHSPFLIDELNAGDSAKILLSGSLNANNPYGTVFSNTATVYCTTPDPNISNNNEIKNVTVSARSDMSISLTGPSTIVAGTKITYAISVVNNGPSNSNSLVICDTLPEGILNAEYSLNGGNTWGVWNGNLNLPQFNYPGNNNILLRGDLSPGETGILENIASVSSTAVDKNIANNSSIKSTTITQVADIIISMSETISPLQKNGKVIYKISVWNNGPGDASNVSISDIFNSEMITNPIYYTGLSWVTWTGSLSIGNLKNNSSKTIEIWGTVSESAINPLVNTASVSTSVTDPDPSNNIQTLQTPFEKEANISVQLNGPATKKAGEQIQYSITVINQSTDTNAENVNVIDILEKTQVNNPEYSVDGGINWSNWKAKLNIGTINAGGSYSLKIRGQLYSSASGILKDTVYVSSDTPDPVSGNNMASFSTSIDLSSDLSVVKTILSSSDDIIEGSKIKFLLTYNNAGPSDANDFFINDIPSSELSNFEVSYNTTSYIPWFGSTNAGTLIAGGTGSLIIRGTITGNVSGSVSNSASVVSNSTDPNETNNSSQITTPVLKRADLGITISKLTNPIIAGDTFYYTLSVENVGPSGAQNVNILNAVSSEMLNTKYSLNEGLTWNNWTGLYHLETLTAGSSFNILIKSETKNDLINGSLINFSTSLGSSTNDPKIVNNSFQASATIGSNANLAIEKYVDINKPSVGDQIMFTLMAINYGPSRTKAVKVTDILPSGFRYISDNGNGAYNPLTGIWTIGNLGDLSTSQLQINATVLSNGVYSNTALISGVDDDPDHSNNISVVNIVPDIEAICVVNIPQNVDSYNVGQTLASVTDGDGNLVSASLLSGILPSGASLDTVSGRIYVSDSTHLIAGSYDFTIKSKDENGGITLLPVVITINSDSESIYTVASARNADDYATGETIATVSDSDGKLVKIDIISGSIPAGVRLNNETGDFTISDTSLLPAGSFPITISTLDELGGKTTQIVTIVINPDNESHYIVYPPKLIAKYINGDTLAFVSDIDGEIITAILVAGILPPGSEFNPVSGDIRIVDSDQLVAGAYRVNIRTIDEDGGLTTQVVTIVILEKIESVYTIEPPRNVDAYRNGDTLAYITSVNGEIISAVQVSGSIPPGTNLDSLTGLITVNDLTQLIAGTFSSVIQSSDNFGGVSELIVSIEIKPDYESVYTVMASHNLFTYYNGEVLASVTDPNGPIISAILQSGILPPGIALNNVTGEISVSDASQLVAAIYSFVIKTIDSTNGITVRPITISFVAADLSITKTCSPQIVVAGESLTYTLKVTNHGPNDALGVVVTDLLPAGLSLVTTNASAGSWTNPVWNIGQLANGSSVTLKIEALLSSNTTGSIINTAKVTSLTSDPFPGNDSAEINSIVTARAELIVTLAATPDTVTAGENITYSLVVVNKGPSDAKNIVLTDNLPSNINFVSASDGGIFSGNKVIWTLTGLKRNETRTFSLIANTNSNLSEGTVITNRVEGKSDNSAMTVYSNIVKVSVKTYSNLSLQKTASLKTIQAGKIFSYTIFVTNNGPSDAKNVRITDQLPSSLSFISASGNGTFADGAVVWNPGVLANGDNFTCSVEVLVKGSVSNGTVVSNKANVTGSNTGLPVESNSENVLVVAVSQLEILKTASSNFVLAGNEFSYSIDINNTGPSDAVNITVVDTLPAGLTFVSASNGGILVNGIVKWTEPLLTGGSGKKYSIFVHVNNDVSNGTVVRNLAYVNSDNSDHQVGSTPVEITVHAQSELIIQKNAVASVISGENMTYSIQVFNNGPSDAPNVLVTDTLPLGVKLVSESSGSTVSDGIVNWIIPSMKSGSNQIFTMVVNVDGNIPDGSHIFNKASVRCDISDEPVVSNEVSTTVTTFSLIANDDEGIPIVGTKGGIFVENVLANDIFKAIIVDTSFVDLSLVSSASSHISLNEQTGQVIVTSGTPAGIYQLIYRICLSDYPHICDDATVTISVLAPEIKAFNDLGDTLFNTEGGVAVEDIIANDLLNGDPVNTSEITITLVTPAAVPGIDLNTATGKVTVSPGTAYGDYEMTYRICEILNPSNCDEATITVTIISAEECELFIPTGFSPNGDGIHDNFLIKCIEEYPDAMLEVYNRWGNLVYKKENYGNVDIWGEADAWWNGFSNKNLNFGKELLPPGTYFFILKLNKGAEKPVAGSVFLNR